MYMIPVMSERLLRICAIIILSVALMYSGVAWAVNNCLREHAHTEQDVPEHHHHEHDSDNHKDSQGSSNPIVHCTSLFDDAGPSAVVASFNLFRSGKALPLYFSSIPHLVFPAIETDVWLQSLFKRNLTIPFPTDRPHLFLSILQI